MRIVDFSRAGFLAVAVLVPTACENPGSTGTPGLKNSYLVARQALESGNYPLALARYGRLVDTAGPAETRVRLEYAHTLLRANDFDKAAEQAGIIVAGQSGAARASALAVRGTARHEQARALADQGERGGAVSDLLRQARADLQDFIGSHPELDTAGTMRARLGLIDADLARLG